MKTGMETPSREKPMKIWSAGPFLRTAEMIPQMIPTIQANREAKTASFNVFTKAAPIRRETGFPSE